MASVTNGWNVVCALDETQVNLLLQQQYLAAGTGSAGGPLTFALWAPEPVNEFGPYLAAAVVYLLPPQISLSQLAEGQMATASAAVESAMIVSADAAMWFSPQCLAAVERNIRLEQVAGTVENSIGSVAVTFPGGPIQQFPRTLYKGLTDYLANGPVTFVLGHILQTNPGPGLEPASFQLAIQSDGNNSALLLLITTTGEPGTAPELTQYPLTGGATAALIIAEGIFMSEVLPGALTTNFNAGASSAGYPPVSPITFTWDGASTYTAAGGPVNLGNLYMSTWSPVSQPIPDLSVVISTEGVLPIAGEGASLTVQVVNGGIQQTCNTSSSMVWSCTTQDLLPSGDPDPDFPEESGNVTSPMVFSYSCTGMSLDPVTDTVTFGGPAACNLAPASNGPDLLTSSWVFAVLKQSTLGSSVTNTPFDSATVFPYLSAPSINAFALANLLFPNSTLLTLDSVSLPGDLVLTGHLTPAFSIQPQTVTLAPGATQQFTASLPNVGWECDHGKGAIDRTTGLYTAPTAAAAQTITITAVDMNNGNSVNAHVNIVVPSTGLVVSPTTALILATSNPTVPIFATDTAGNPVEVQCTCSDSAVSLMRLDVGYWVFAYLNFNAVGSTFTISVTSVADPSLTATVTTAVAFTDMLQVNYDSSTGTASVVSVSGSGRTEFFWAVTPASAGFAVPMPGNTTQAGITITQPGVSFGVCAYYADLESSSYGFGSAFVPG